MPDQPRFSSSGEVFFFFLHSLRSVHSGRKHPHVSLDCIHIGISVAQNAKGYTAARSATRCEHGVLSSFRHPVNELAGIAIDRNDRCADTTAG